MNIFVRTLVLAGTALSIGAAPPAKLISVGNYGEAIVMPVGSSLRLRKIEYDAHAYFSGKIVVEGTWVLDCNSLSCEPGEGNKLHLSIIPSPATIARLPRWKVHNNDIRIDISNADRFINSVTTTDERKRLLAGRLPDIRGEAALLVDEFEAGLDCDSANYSARFLAVTKAAKRAGLPAEGDYGCGYVELSSGAPRLHARF